jgi:hypothetical protein
MNFRQKISKMVKKLHMSKITTEPHVRHTSYAPNYGLESKEKIHHYHQKAYIQLILCIIIHQARRTYDGV